jgi:hypothetical protein
MIPCSLAFARKRSTTDRTSSFDTQRLSCRTFLPRKTQQLRHALAQTISLTNNQPEIALVLIAQTLVFTHNLRDRLDGRQWILDLVGHGGRHATERRETLTFRKLAFES